MKAGGQGAGHHRARPRPFTAACRHGLASSQECFTYLCQKWGRSVQPLLTPWEVGGTWKADWLWPSLSPRLGRRTHRRTRPPTGSCRSTCMYEHTPSTHPNTHTGSHCVHTLAHGTSSPAQAHVHTPTFTQSHACPNAHIPPCTCLLVSSCKHICIHPHTLAHCTLTRDINGRL